MTSPLLVLLLTAPTPWAIVQAPTRGPARAIGGYSAGCIAGAVALPMTGAGFRVAKPERKRVFGHPLLIALIRDLGRQLKAAHLGALAVGDLSQPRGGPAPTGHASHQTGLDADVFFGAPARLAKLLELVATDARVDRVFVNPAIKRDLCANATGSREWLRKIRPWWGHDDHFHMRLACPPDSPDCVGQTPVPAGDGCAALDWWFSPAAAADRDQAHNQYGARVGAAPALPARCSEIVN